MSTNCDVTDWPIRKVAGAKVQCVRDNSNAVHRSPTSNIRNPVSNESLIETSHFRFSQCIANLLSFVVPVPCKFDR